MLNANNTVGVLNLDEQHPRVSQIPVGNAPNSIVVQRQLRLREQRGRPARDARADFTNLSDGTAIVVDPTDAYAITGTVSVINIRTGELVTKTIGGRPASRGHGGLRLDAVRRERLQTTRCP